MGLHANLNFGVDGTPSIMLFDLVDFNSANLDFLHHQFIKSCGFSYLNYNQIDDLDSNFIKELASPSLECLVNFKDLSF